MRHFSGRGFSPAHLCLLTIGVRENQRVFILTLRENSVQRYSSLCSLASRIFLEYIEYCQKRLEVGVGFCIQTEKTIWLPETCK